MHKSSFFTNQKRVNSEIGGKNKNNFKYILVIHKYFEIIFSNYKNVCV